MGSEMCIRDSNRYRAKSIGPQQSNIALDQWRPLHRDWVDHEPIACFTGMDGGELRGIRLGTLLFQLWFYFEQPDCESLAPFFRRKKSIARNDGLYCSCANQFF